MKRSPMKRRHKNTGPDTATVETVLERDGRCCRWCGFGISGERGRDWSLHHRLPRRMGGTSRPEVNQPANLVTVHGNGSQGCHHEIERRRADAQAHGWLLFADDNPADRPILLDREGAWKYFDNDGGESWLPPGESEIGWPEDEEMGA